MILGKEIHKISGQIVDVVNREIYPGEITIKANKIHSVTRLHEAPEVWIMPGLVDAHIHIESSMLVPAEFAKLAVLHGTVATVSDPHEIANVLGIEGVKYMIENGKQVSFHFHFGAPSCVPATGFETAGANLGVAEVELMLDMREIGYLSEMMNYPGVLTGDKEVLAKIKAAHDRGMPVDGHAPGLSGDDTLRYIEAGISTDHECFTLEEAVEKVEAGMHILIREGSAAKNFEALFPLLQSHPDKVMFCSDDKHPNDLVKGHINQLIARAIQKGIPILDAVSAATLNPKKHYNLPIGLLQPGDWADYIVVENLEKMKVLKTVYHGNLVAEAGKSKYYANTNFTPNNFNCIKIEATDLEIHFPGGKIRVIEAIEGQLVTAETQELPKVSDGKVVSDVGRDILKMVVLNRYKPSKPAIGFIRNFGLTSGAIASSIAHDSHNIIAVGVDDLSLAEAINLVIEEKGGIAVAGKEENAVLSLPVAGLMSTLPGNQVAERYEELDRLAKSLGSKLQAPFMTLSFMALLVIPDLKLSDQGLFSGKQFGFSSLFC